MASGLVLLVLSCTMDSDLIPDQDAYPPVDTGAVFEEEDSGQEDVPVVGSDEDPCYYTDTFVHEYNPTTCIDVLAVVDYSCSMVDEKEKVANSVEDHLANVVTTYEDPSVMIISAHPGEPGIPIDEENYEAVQYGFNQVDVEKPFSAALVGLEEAENSGIFNSLCSTHIIMYSDEDDQSWSNEQISDYDAASRFVTEVGALRPENFYFTAVVTPTPSSSSYCNPQTKYTGQRFMHVSNLLSPEMTVVNDICAPWEEWEFPDVDQSEDAPELEAIWRVSYPIHYDEVLNDHRFQIFIGGSDATSSCVYYDDTTMIECPGINVVPEEKIVVYYRIAEEIVGVLGECPKNPGAD